MVEVKNVFVLEKYKKLSLPAKATIWFTVCNFAIKGISFFTAPLFTRLMSTEEYGKLTVYLSYEQLILILATWEIQLGAYQKGIFKYKGEEKSFTTATQALINIITLACFALALVLNKQITSLTGMSLMLIVLMFVHLLFRPAYNCWLTRQRINYKYVSGVIVTLLYSVVSIAVPMVAILTISRTADVKLAFTLIGTTIICIVFYVRHASYWTLKDNFARTKEYWKFCIIFEGPLVLHSLSFLILSQADRVMIEKMVGASQAAFYGVAYTIASVVTIFQHSISTTLAPWRYQMLEEKNYRAIKDVTNGLLIGFGAITLLFILVVPEMMKILFSADYYEAVWCIPPVSAGVYFMFLYSIFVNIEEYYEKTKYVVYVSVTCGIINIILNYFCIGIFGYIACAYTTVFSYILFALGHYYFTKRTLKGEGVEERVVDGKIVFLISSVVMGGSVIITLLYNYPIVRYVLFAVAVLICYINKNKIIDIYRVVKKRS